MGALSAARPRPPPRSVPLGSRTSGGRDVGLPHAYNKEREARISPSPAGSFRRSRRPVTPASDEAIQRCCTYLESKQTKDGGFGKTSRDEHCNQWILTGCGVLGLQTLANNKTTSVKKGIRFLRDFLTAEPLSWDRNCNLYCWCYYT